MSSTDVFKKLRLDNTKRALILNSPTEYTAMLNKVRYDSKYDPKNAGTYEFVQVFATTQAELERLLKQVAKAGKYDCLFWACYPKGTGKIKSDLKRDTLWEALDTIDLRAVSQIAIDDTWSAMRGRPHEVVGK